MCNIHGLSFILCALISLGSSHPSATSMNPQPIQNNQLPTGDSHREPANIKPVEQSVSQYMYRTNVGNQQTPYVSNYAQTSGYQAGYARDATQQPFFGLSSNGEFQLSAYFSQIFWGFVALIVGVAAIIWLIRLFFPQDSFGEIVKKMKESGSGRAIDLDRLTNLVYGALDSYGKWITKDTRDSTGQHPKRR